MAKLEELVDAALTGIGQETAAEGATVLCRDGRVFFGRGAVGVSAARAAVSEAVGEGEEGRVYACTKLLRGFTTAS